MGCEVQCEPLWGRHVALAIGWVPFTLLLYILWLWWRQHEWTRTRRCACTRWCILGVTIQRSQIRCRQTRRSLRPLNQTMSAP